LTTKYTKENLEEIVKESFSIFEVLRRLELVCSGGNHSHISKLIKDFEIDKSHFLGQGHSKGKILGPKYTKETFLETLKKDTKILGHRLVKRLVFFGIKERRCEICKNDIWNEKPIPLELDHIDGEHSNNELENIRILCPNCHAQTDTYCSKNMNKKISIIKLEKKKYFCDCGNEKHRSSKKCKICSNRSLEKFNNGLKIEWPSDEELLKELEVKSYLELSKEIGVCDNSIRKHLKKRIGYFPSKRKVNN